MSDCTSSHLSLAFIPSTLGSIYYGLGRDFAVSTWQPKIYTVRQKILYRLGIKELLPFYLQPQNVLHSKPKSRCVYNCQYYQLRWQQILSWSCSLYWEHEGLQWDRPQSRQLSFEVIHCLGQKPTQMCVNLPLQISYFWNCLLKH